MRRDGQFEDSLPWSRDGGVSRPLRALVLGALRCYKLAVSPWLPPACRFFPTCSEYAAMAVERYGVRRGGWMALRRLSRCHPFHAGGFDPVP